MERLRPKWFFAILLVSSLGLLVFMVSILYDLTRTEKEIIDRYLSRPMGVLHAEVTAYFRPMFLAINSAAGHHQKGIYDQSNLSATCKYFSTLVQTHPEIESVGIADMRGNELDLLHSEGNWETRMVSPKSGSSTWMKWNSACNKVDSVWSGTFTHDPRSRPWYTGAMQSVGEPHCTFPYQFNTNQKMGITISKAFTSGMEMDTVIIALDVTINNLCQTIFSMPLGNEVNGFILPRNQSEETEKAVLNAAVNPKQLFVRNLPDSIKDQYAEAFSVFSNTAMDERYGPMRFNYRNEPYWCLFARFGFLNNEHFTLGVVIKEDLILHQVNRSKRLVILGIFVVNMFILVLTRSQWSMKKSSDLLKEVNLKIHQQNQLISLKNKRLNDSISYAESLQKGLLQQKEELDAVMPPYFLTYLPKDVVSGDFYWFKKHHDGKIFFAVGDCTGHGVPGALLSILSLDMIRHVFASSTSIQLDHILEQLKLMMAGRIASMEHGHMDGMDLAMCGYCPKEKTMSFCGAYNAVYIISDRDHLKISNKTGEKVLVPEISDGKRHLYTVRGQRIPIGLSQITVDNKFVEQRFNVVEGDTIFLTSDGLSDQFGEETQKKLGSKKMKELFLQVERQPLPNRHIFLVEKINTWRGSETQTDDICCLSVTISGQIERT